MSFVAPRRTSRPRLAFLGVGWIGRRRMEAISRSGVGEIVVVSDENEEAAQSAQPVAPDARITTSFDDVLRAEIDGLVIATPSALHAAQAIRALDRGIAVFCQKPLGRSAKETSAVVDAARRADRLLGVDLSYRQTEAMKRVRETVQAGELGDVFAVNLLFHNAYGPDKPWFYDPRQSGGGCVVDLGIHMVDLTLWTLGFPAVRAVSSNLFRAGRRLLSARDEVEDYAAVQLTLEDGCVVQLACSWKLAAGCDAVIEASFFGPRGGATMRNVNGSFYDFTAERLVGTQRQPLCGPPDDWGGRAAVAWATKLSSDRRFDPEVARVVEVAEVLDRIRGGAIT